MWFWQSDPWWWTAGQVGLLVSDANVQILWSTSLISFILAPPFPIREPHWLAGMTSRRVTGGFVLMVPLATNVARS